MAIITGDRVRNFVIAAMGLALIASAASAIDERQSQQKTGKQHTIVSPVIDPTIASGCVAEAAAYAEALAALEIAAAAADEAYDAWYECELENSQPVPIDMSQIPSQSVLVRD